MRLDALVGESPVLDAARRNLHRAEPGTWVLRVLLSWEELLCRAQGQAFDIALVQVTFPVQRSSDSDGVRLVERADQISENAVLIPVIPGSSRSPPFLRRLDPGRFPIVLMEGTDDHPQVVLRALARASVLRRSRGIPFAPSGAPDPVTRQAATSFVAHWPPADSPEALARRRKVSPRTLRRQCSRRGLPTPRHLLRWARLLEAFALWEMGVGNREFIAFTLGAAGASTLAHLSKDLLGEPLDQVMRPGGGDDLHRAFFKDLAG